MPEAPRMNPTYENEGKFLIVTRLTPRERPLGSIRQQRIAEYCLEEASRRRRVSKSSGKKAGGREENVALKSATLGTEEVKEEAQKPERSDDASPFPPDVRTREVLRSTRLNNLYLHADDVKVLFPPRDMLYSGSELAMMSADSSQGTVFPEKMSLTSNSDPLASRGSEENLQDEFGMLSSAALRESPVRPQGRGGDTETSTATEDRYLNTPALDGYVPCDVTNNASDEAANRSDQAVKSEKLCQTNHDGLEIVRDDRRCFGKTSGQVLPIDVERGGKERRVKLSSSNVEGALFTKAVKYRRGICQPTAVVPQTRTTHHFKVSNHAGRTSKNRMAPSRVSQRHSMPIASSYGVEDTVALFNVVSEHRKARRFELIKRTKNLSEYTRTGTVPASSMGTLTETRSESKAASLSAPKDLKCPPYVDDKPKNTVPRSNTSRPAIHPSCVTSNLLFRPRFSVPMKASRIPMEVLYKQSFTDHFDRAEKYRVPPSELQSCVPRKQHVSRSLSPSNRTTDALDNSASLRINHIWALCRDIDQNTKPTVRFLLPEKHRSISSMTARNSLSLYPQTCARNALSFYPQAQHGDVFRKTVGFNPSGEYFAESAILKSTVECRPGFRTTIASDAHVLTPGSFLKSRPVMSRSPTCLYKPRKSGAAFGTSSRHLREFPRGCIVDSSQPYRKSPVELDDLRPGDDRYTATGTFRRKVLTDDSVMHSSKEISAPSRSRSKNGTEFYSRLDSTATMPAYKYYQRQTEARVPTDFYAQRNIENYHAWVFGGATPRGWVPPSFNAPRHGENCHASGTEEGTPHSSVPPSYNAQHHEENHYTSGIEKGTPQTRASPSYNAPRHEENYHASDTEKGTLHSSVSPSYNAQLHQENRYTSGIEEGTPHQYALPSYNAPRHEQKYYSSDMEGGTPRTGVPSSFNIQCHEDNYYASGTENGAPYSFRQPSFNSNSHEQNNYAPGIEGCTSYSTVPLTQCAYTKPDEHESYLLQYSRAWGQPSTEDVTLTEVPVPSQILENNINPIQFRPSVDFSRYTAPPSPCPCSRFCNMSCYHRHCPLHGNYQSWYPEWQYQPRQLSTFSGQVPSETALPNSPSGEYVCNSPSYYENLCGARGSSSRPILKRCSMPESLRGSRSDLCCCGAEGRGNTYMSASGQERENRYEESPSLDDNELAKLIPPIRRDTFGEIQINKEDFTVIRPSKSCHQAHGKEYSLCVDLTAVHATVDQPSVMQYYDKPMCGSKSPEQPNQLDLKEVSHLCAPIAPKLNAVSETGDVASTLANDEECCGPVNPNTGERKGCKTNTPNLCEPATPQTSSCKQCNEVSHADSCKHVTVGTSQRTPCNEASEEASCSSVTRRANECKPLNHLNEADLCKTATVETVESTPRSKASEAAVRVPVISPANGCKPSVMANDVNFRGYVKPRASGSKPSRHWRAVGHALARCTKPSHRTCADFCGQEKRRANESEPHTQTDDVGLHEVGNPHASGSKAYTKSTDGHWNEYIFRRASQYKTQNQEAGHAQSPVSQPVKAVRFDADIHMAAGLKGSKDITTDLPACEKPHSDTVPSVYAGQEALTADTVHDNKSLQDLCTTELDKERVDRNLESNDAQPYSNEVTNNDTTPKEACLDSRNSMEPTTESSRPSYNGCKGVFDENVSKCFSSELSFEMIHPMDKDHQVQTIGRCLGTSFFPCAQSEERKATPDVRNRYPDDICLTVKSGASQDEIVELAEEVSDTVKESAQVFTSNNRSLEISEIISVVKTPVADVSTQVPVVTVHNVETSTHRAGISKMSPPLSFQLLESTADVPPVSKTTESIGTFTDDFLCNANIVCDGALEDTVRDERGNTSPPPEKSYFHRSIASDVSTSDVNLHFTPVCSCQRSKSVVFDMEEGQGSRSVVFDTEEDQRSSSVVFDMEESQRSRSAVFDSEEGYSNATYGSEQNSESEHLRNFGAFFRSHGSQLANVCAIAMVPFYEQPTETRLLRDSKSRMKKCSEPRHACSSRYFHHACKHEHRGKPARQPVHEKRGSIRGLRRESDTISLKSEARSKASTNGTIPLKGDNRPEQNPGCFGNPIQSPPTLQEAVADSRSGVVYDSDRCRSSCCVRKLSRKVSENREQGPSPAKAMVASETSAAIDESEASRLIEDTCISSSDGAAATRKSHYVKWPEKVKLKRLLSLDLGAECKQVETETIGVSRESFSGSPKSTEKRNRKNSGSSKIKVDSSSKEEKTIVENFLLEASSVSPKPACPLCKSWRSKSKKKSILKKTGPESASVDPTLVGHSAVPAPNRSCDLSAKALNSQGNHVPAMNSQWQPAKQDGGSKIQEDVHVTFADNKAGTLQNGSEVSRVNCVDKYQSSCKKLQCLHCLRNLISINAARNASVEKVESEMLFQDQRKENIHSNFEHRKLSVILETSSVDLDRSSTFLSEEQCHPLGSVPNFENLVVESNSLTVTSDSPCDRLLPKVRLTSASDIFSGQNDGIRDVSFDESYDDFTGMQESTGSTLPLRIGNKFEEDMMPLDSSTAFIKLQAEDIGTDCRKGCVFTAMKRYMSHRKHRKMTHMEERPCIFCSDQDGEHNCEDPNICAMHHDFSCCNERWFNLDCWSDPDSPYVEIFGDPNTLNVFKREDNYAPYRRNRNAVGVAAEHPDPVVLCDARRDDSAQFQRMSDRLEFSENFFAPNHEQLNVSFSRPKNDSSDEFCSCQLKLNYGSSKSEDITIESFGGSCDQVSTDSLPQDDTTSTTRGSSTCLLGACVFCHGGVHAPQTRILLPEPKSTSSENPTVCKTGPGCKVHHTQCRSLRQDPIRYLPGYVMSPDLRLCRICSLPSTDIGRHDVRSPKQTQGSHRSAREHTADAVPECGHLQAAHRNCSCNCAATKGVRWHCKGRCNEYCCGAVVPDSGLH